MATTPTTHFALNDEQVARYAEDGYLLLKGALSREEAAELRREAHALIARVAVPVAALGRVLSYIADQLPELGLFFDVEPTIIVSMPCR